MAPAWYLAEDPALGADVFVLVHALATKADAPEAMIAREVGFFDCTPERPELGTSATASLSAAQARAAARPR